MKEARGEKPMVRQKHEFARFCARIERRCARMNSGLTAVVLVLAATTLFVRSLQFAEEVTHDPQWSSLPFIEMSADSPDTVLWAMGD
jgi:hypothetical protein